ncbi:MAG TPA: acyl-CoA dehydratase activase [Candidatus Eisenbacteria bacterium]|nr:acyl-CoA dehydratase activase [Candidatus Eisenbacteria bacterium]
MSFVAGIDIGAKLTKSLVLDGQRRICASATIKTTPDFPQLARDALAMALREAGLKEPDIQYTATTGFGRYNVPFRDLQITDITCVARGAVFLFPKTRSILDIGAQSTRAIRVFETGKVRDFRTNDKCAAGAGGFIERTAKYLETGIEDVGELSLRADHAETISSVCAVLAESEIINHVSNGQTVENILFGVHKSLASRALALLKRAGMEDEITFVGGVARQKGMVKALEETLGRKVNVSDAPEMVGALGAALLALRRLEKLRQDESTAPRRRVAEGRRSQP